MNAASLAVSVADLARLDRLAAERGLVVVPDAPLGPLTTLRVGGPADRLAVAGDHDALLAYLNLARDVDLPCFILGNGSDLVVSDLGIRGLVVRNRSRSLTLDGTELRADSGTPMAILVRRCVAAGLSGLEFGTAIPGTLGGAVWANAGAHGGAMSELVTAVEAWDPRDGETRLLDNAACAYTYRDSRFKHGPEVVLAATLQLRTDAPDVVAARVAANQAHRIATQPLAEQNAGSVFRNPPGDHAGRLIDAAGLKGERIGSASVSTRHANFIITDRKGRAADVRSLGDLIRRVVSERFGIELEYEIEFVGEWRSRKGRVG